MAIKGMDISYWQGNVDFARVAADGIKFAILREGYAQTVDAKFRQYVDGCRRMASRSREYIISVMHSTQNRQRRRRHSASSRWNRQISEKM